MRTIRRFGLFLRATSPVLLGFRSTDLLRVPEDKQSSPHCLVRADIREKASVQKILYIAFAFCLVTRIASPAQTFSTLADFDYTDGASPRSSLAQGTDGNLYGTTIVGGANGLGTVFKITPTGTITTIYSFCSQTQPYCGDGYLPYGGLVQGRDGNFYGTTSEGGVNGLQYGTVFKVTPSGALTTLYSFCPQSGCPDGENPNAGVVQGSDGDFYGTTVSGGAYGSNAGTVFRMTPSGTLVWVYSFCANLPCADGRSPYAALVQASDGNFYGTTSAGGSNQLCDNGCGTIFKITPSGTLTTVHNFCTLTSCADGYLPYAGLVQAADGNLYGAASNSGEGGAGTVFKITLSGNLTVVYTFCSLTGCSDGETPYAGPVQGIDGNFYGTTESGGNGGLGTVFKLTPSGTLTRLHSFDGNDGELPFAGLVQASDGNLYGTTSFGGSQGDGGVCPSGCGTVFKVTGLPRSTTSVTSAPNPSMSGQLVTITATVGPAGPPMPTGTVSFTSNGTAIPGCTSVLLGSSLTAVCMTSTLAVGTDAIVATYSGDGNYSGSSGMLSQIVNPLPVAVQFVPVTPCRVYDSRPSHGGTGAIQGGTSQDFNLPQLSQAGPCASTGLDLSLATVYSLNITVIPHGSLGYLTLWPTGKVNPRCPR